MPKTERICRDVSSVRRLQASTPSAEYRCTRGPTTEAWKLRRKEIVAMYMNRPLGHVRKEMLRKYKFDASKRMYDDKFRQWNVHKNLRRRDKERILSRIALNEKIEVDPKQLKQIMRYVRSRTKETSGARSATIHGVELTTQVSITDMDGSALSQDDSVNTPRSHMGLADTRATKDIAASDWVDITFNGLDLRGANDNRTPRPGPIIFFSPGFRNTEMLMTKIDQYFDSRLVRVASDAASDSAVQLEFTAASKTFWSNIENGLYLLKIAERFPDPDDRAFTAFHQACDIVGEALAIEPFDFIRKIVYTLSPTNTTIFPQLRRLSLQLIAHEASQRLSPSHPIVTICDALACDGDDPLLSRQALSHMHTLSCRRLGHDHAVSNRLQNSVITLTRRAGELGIARALAEGAFELAIISKGRGSHDARRAAVTLAHIFTSMGEHERALQLRLEVVRDRVVQTTFPDQGGTRLWAEACQEDEIAVHAMEDVAESYANRGMTRQSLLWLRKAEGIGFRLWSPDDVAIKHISDKLNALLQELQEE